MKSKKIYALALIVLLAALSIAASNSGIWSIDRKSSHVRIDGAGEIRVEPRSGQGTTFAAGTVNLTAATVIGVEDLLSTTASVNMNTATATTLFTCPTGKSCVVTRVAVRNASTSLTTASYSFGWNSASFNDVIANATHTELTGNTLYTVLLAKTGATVGTSTGTFKVLMNTLQGGAATTTIDVFGYYF